jgi:hypothetical protein
MANFTCSGRGGRCVRRRAPGSANGRSGERSDGGMRRRDFVLEYLAGS